jgi:formate hydrogenlyase subunit 6/NADH:ubiquinone oxidoreductase subunit I
MRTPDQHPHVTANDLPVLDETVCTGNGVCVEVCPTQCLAMGPHVPWLPRPADCISCGLCAAVCPTAALRMETATDASG